MIRTLLLFSLILWTSGALADPLRVLFVGNSYLRYNGGVPTLAERLANAEAPRLEAYSNLINDSALYQHDLTEALSERAFDLVVLQGHSTEMTTAKKRARFAKALTAVTGLISEMQPDARIALYMTPAYTSVHPRYDPEMFSKVSQGYREEALRVGAFVIPVGLAFELAYGKRPEIELHLPDGSHPSPLGTALAAATVQATLFDTIEVTVGELLPDQISTSDAEFLMTIAALAVTFERGCPLEDLGTRPEETYLSLRGTMGDPIC